MDYALKISLQGSDRLRPLAARMVREVGELRDGPGEEEIERLAVAMDPLVATVLASLRDLPDPPTVDLLMETSAVRMVFRLEVPANPGIRCEDLLGSRKNELLGTLRQAFDEVEGPDCEGDTPFRMLMTRHIPC